MQTDPKTRRELTQPGTDSDEISLPSANQRYCQDLRRLRGISARMQQRYNQILKAAMALLLAFSMLAAPIQPAYATGSAFTERTGGANPLNVDVGTYSAPSFVDLDADGDLDAFIGEGDGFLNYFENTGTALAPAFTECTGDDNPLNVDVGSDSAPSFADVDGDGDMDAFVGEWDGTLNYYQNTGTALAPAFIERTGGANPFNGVDVGNYSAPSFVDVDGDGDMDAFIGEYDGFLNYFENTGTALSPVFTEETGGANPFNGVDVGNASAPNFADVDGDGDMDAFIGEQGGIINYYQNTGTALSPVFTEETGSANPFNGVDVGNYSAPCFVDMDGDRDMDAFIGEDIGTINYYQNTHCSFTSENSGALAGGDVFHFGNGESRVTVKVNSTGNPALTDITVTCNASTHANASANMMAGAYWSITPNAGAGGTTPFDLDLTMSFKNPISGEDKLCRYTGGPGTGWECDQDSLTATTITQNNVQSLSDWTVGDNVGPTAIRLQSFTSWSSNRVSILAVGITFLTGLVVVLGKWWKRRKG